jgi:CheY-like chemotaxis protein
MIELMAPVALVVDDDPDFLAVAAMVLAELGARTVLTAPDTVSAFRKARAGRPQAILVDVGFPDREGIDLAWELAELPWGPRVVLTSADPDAGRLVELRQSSRAIPFLPKEKLVNGSLRGLLIGGHGDGVRDGGPGSLD